MSFTDYLVHRTRPAQNRMRAALLAGHVPKWISNRPRNRYIAQAIISMPPWGCRWWTLWYLNRFRKLFRELGFKFSVGQQFTILEREDGGLVLRREPRPEVNGAPGVFH